MKSILLTVAFFLSTIPIFCQKLTRLDSIQTNLIHPSHIDQNIIITRFPRISATEKNLHLESLINCVPETDILGEDESSNIIKYNVDLNSYNVIAPMYSFKVCPFDYLASETPKIVAAIGFDSIYYYQNSSWVFSGYTAPPSSNFINVGCGRKSTYFVGQDIWYFNGTSEPRKIRDNISYTVADVAVDENENVWILTGNSFPISDTLRIIDSTGVSICDIPFIEPINTFNAYGMTIFNGKVIVGFGRGNFNFPNALMSLELNEMTQTVSFGQEIGRVEELWGDLGGCDKVVDLPSCLSVNNIEPLTESKIQIFPIPAQEYISVKTSNNHDSFTVSIFNSKGVLVHQKSNASSNGIIRINHLPGGLYIVRIREDNNTQPSYHRLVVE